MPFRVCNAPATFQRAVDILSSRFQWRSFLFYLDDIIVFSSSIDERRFHVHKAVSVLRRAGVSLKPTKCQFSASRVYYLGHVIHPGKLELASKNTEALKVFKARANETEVWSFLGLCNVYGRFVPNFARIATPLNAVLKKGTPVGIIEFTQKQVQPFDSRKRAMEEPPLLRLLKKGLPFSVDTDGCEHQIGCAVFQEYPDNVRYPISSCST